ncbi:hypothetical protein [Corynebacterium sp. HMSC076D02]|uniref:hypothetical protein n=1 Tax=Corynebacterium sp. HMSC076D02 TaxID=1739439 RepID=UPI0008A13EB0|nr:hypothetical protein [Corynebacterium sp. HMSC076D02]OFQ48127.1 hypothetical protein HMPREF2935_00880 [Corynebacterium sp. HMSC076D02]
MGAAVGLAVGVADAAVVALGAGVDGGAALGLGFGVGVGGLFGFPGVVDECAQQSGAFGLGASVEFSCPGGDGRFGDAGVAGAARSVR